MMSASSNRTRLKLARNEGLRVIDSLVMMSRLVNKKHENQTETGLLSFFKKVMAETKDESVRIYLQRPRKVSVRYGRNKNKVQTYCKQHLHSHQVIVSLR